MRDWEIQERLELISSQHNWRGEDILLTVEHGNEVGGGEGVEDEKWEGSERDESGKTTWVSDFSFLFLFCFF